MIRRPQCDNKFWIAHGGHPSNIPGTPGDGPSSSGAGAEVDCAQTPQCCRCVTYANGANASLPFKPGNGNTSVPDSHHVRLDRNRLRRFRAARAIDPIKASEYIFCGSKLCLVLIFAPQWATLSGHRRNSNPPITQCCAVAGIFSRAISGRPQWLPAQ